MSAPDPKMALIADESEKAQRAQLELMQLYSFIELGKKRASSTADVMVVLGGDGFMLQAMHRFMDRPVTFYGMNCGTVGFLMNSYSPDHLAERIAGARRHVLHPLSMYARGVNGRESELLAINEVSLLRQTRQAAKIRVTVDHVMRIPEMIADGILVSTPAGSTAYNSSAGGPIIPLGGNLLALTPLSPFRPRRWRGALLSHTSSVNFDILEADKRPVSVVADFTELRDIASVAVSEQRKIAISLLFDPEHNLEERMIKEQFMY